jgi:hypothetical protein
MCHPPSTKVAAGRGISILRFEECWSSTRGTAGFPNCTFARTMALTFVRAKERSRSIGVKTFGGDDECWNIMRSLADIGHCCILVVQFLPNDLFSYAFKLFIIEAALIVSGRNNPHLDPIDLKHSFRKVHIFVDTLVNRLSELNPLELRNYHS